MHPSEHGTHVQNTREHTLSSTAQSALYPLLGSSLPLWGSPRSHDPIEASRPLSLGNLGTFGYEAV